MGWKMPFCKWHTFWLVPCLICSFIFMLFHIERRWILMRTLATILHLKSKLSEKFQRVNTIDESIKMLKNSWISQKFQFKWKIVKHFTRRKQRTALRTLLSLDSTYPPPDKILLRLWNKFFFTKIYRNIRTSALKVLQECGSLASRNSAVQMLLLTPNRNMFPGIFVKSERVLAVLWEHLTLNVKWVEIR